MAKMYLGNVLIGGDVEAQDLTDLETNLQGQIDTIDGRLDGIDLDQTDQDTKIAANKTLSEQNEQSILTLQEEIAIIGNAAVAGRYNLTDQSPSATQLQVAPSATDWTTTTTITMHVNDKVGHNFDDFKQISLEDTIQMGSANGNAMFTVKGINVTPGVSGEFTVEVISATASTHVIGEEVSVTIGSPVDQGNLQQQVSDNAAAIGGNTVAINNLTTRVDKNESDITVLEGEIQGVLGETQQNAGDISQLQTDLDGKFDTGTIVTPMHYGNAVTMDAAVKDVVDQAEANRLAIDGLTNGVDPDVTALEARVDQMDIEVVKNVNMIGDDGSNPDGVQRIEVVPQSGWISNSAQPTTLYIVV